eukprot:1514129-Rhodomonas_salina.2
MTRRPTFPVRRPTMTAMAASFLAQEVQSFIEHVFHKIDICWLHGHLQPPAPYLGTGIAFHLFQTKSTALYLVPNREPALSAIPKAMLVQCTTH